MRMESMDQGYIWVVVLGFVIAFILALGLGANDVANSFGTSVGSKVLSLTGACIVATICETSGALLAGGKVTDAIRKNIVEVDLNVSSSTESEVLVGYLSALSAAAVWLIIATALKLPVSSTHSIVGAMIGFGLVAFGSKSINWKEFAKIALSWIVSPIMAGTLSSIFYLLLQHFVLNQVDSYTTGLRALPILYFIITAVNIFIVFYDGSRVLHFNDISLYGCLILSFGSGLVVALVVQFLVAPYLQKKIDKEFEANEQGDAEPMEILKCHEDDLKTSDTKIIESTFTTSEDNNEKVKLLDDSTKKEKMTNYVQDKETEELYIEEKEKSKDTLVDEPKTARLLAFVQIVTASFASFAHGSNDVSNAIGPLVSLWLSFKSGNIDNHLETPIWILFYGGVGISLGLWIWGRRVIETIGEELSVITPSSGLIIEFGTVFTVLVASNLGIPISTTHCLVGAVILVGLVRSRRVTDWRIFRNIVFAWVITVPVSGLLAAVIFSILRYAV